LEQQSLPKVHERPCGTQVQLAPFGLQTLPRWGSLTQCLEQQSLPKVHERPCGAQVQLLVRVARSVGGALVIAPPELPKHSIIAAVAATSMPRPGTSHIPSA